MKLGLIAVAAFAVVAVPSLAFAEDAKEVIFVVGAINDPSHVEQGQDAADSKIPALPVIYDNGSTDGTSSSQSTQAQISSTPAS